MVTVTKRENRGTEGFNRTKFENSIREATRRTTDARDRADEIARELADAAEQNFRDRDATTDEIRAWATSQLNDRKCQSTATEYNRRDFRRTARESSTGTTARTRTTR